MSDFYTKATDFIAKSIISPKNPTFGYFGSKQRIARQIISGLPPHHAWVEAFCGSAAVTLAKMPAPIEVINDRNDQIVNLFEQLRKNSKALCKAVALTPYARSEFKIASDFESDLTPLEKARRFLVATMMTINATIGNGSGFSCSHSYTRGNREARVNRWYNLPLRIEMIVERFKNVRVENIEALELLDLFTNRPATLVYLDPPYFVKRDHKYITDENNVKFHKKLLEKCNESKCMILISGYENKLYNKMLKRNDGWVKKKIETHTRDSSGKNYARTEILWKNERFVRAETTKRIPIRLSAKEKVDRKINPERFY